MAFRKAQAVPSVLLAFFVNTLQVAVSINLEHLVGNGGNAKFLSSSHDSYFVHAPAPHDSLQSGCRMIQPVSFLQKATHPWIGNYDTTQHCRDVAVLTNTADEATCGHLHLVFMGVVFFLITFGFLVAVLFGAPCLLILLIPVIGCWYYMVSTGLLSDYRSGAMSWDADYQRGLMPHNVSLQCLQFVSTTWIFSLIIGFYFCIFAVLMGPAFVVMRMQVETKTAEVIRLSAEDRKWLNSSEFKQKCMKAFRDADEDHNGVLDLTELEHVAMFDLTEAEQAFVKASSLFKEAFGKCDADNSKSIDQAEFLEVMKFVWCKAKSKPTE